MGLGKDVGGTVIISPLANEITEKKRRTIIDVDM